MSENNYAIKPIGYVRSELVNRSDAPHQGDMGGYDAWLEINEACVDGLMGLEVGDELVLITWLHQSKREVLQVRPRRDPQRKLTGVFDTCSPDRPNPIGLHPVTILAIEANRVQVTPLEAIDATPIVDIKPVRREG